VTGLAASDELAISIVVCTQGRPSLHRTVASAVDSLDRSGVPGEVVVVWQATTAVPDLPGARFVRVVDVSLAHARNRGLDASLGTFVAYVDDDEVVAQEWVTALVDAFASTPRPDAVFGSVAPLDDVGIPYCVQEGDVRTRIRRGKPPWTVGTGGNMAFDRAALCDAGGFDLTFGVGAPSLSAEDSELIWRMSQAGAELLREPAAVVHHPTKTEAERLRARYPYGVGAGRLVRRHREAALGAKYVVMTLQSYWNGWRTGSPRRRREARESLRGFVVGLTTRARWTAPAALLNDAPDELRPHLGQGLCVPLPVHYRARPHYLYQLPAGLLHVYVGPHPELSDGLVLRERLRAAGLPGVPRLTAAAPGVDSLWVLEELASGQSPDPSDRATLEPLAVEWLRSLAAATRGGPLAGDPGWRERSAGVVAAAPAALQACLSAAVEELGTLSSVAVHSDFQTKNLLLDGGGLTVIDWEYASPTGLPGEDLLLFLHSTTTSREPSRLVAVRDGADPALAAGLARVGLPDELHRPAVLLTAARWFFDERRHRMVGSHLDGRDTYARLLLELAGGDA